MVCACGLLTSSRQAAGYSASPHTSLCVSVPTLIWLLKSKIWAVWGKWWIVDALKPAASPAGARPSSLPLQLICTLSSCRGVCRCRQRLHQCVAAPLWPLCVPNTWSPYTGIQRLNVDKMLFPSQHGLPAEQKNYLFIPLQAKSLSKSNFQMFDFN